MCNVGVSVGKNALETIKKCDPYRNLDVKISHHRIFRSNNDRWYGISSNGIWHIKLRRFIELEYRLDTSILLVDECCIPLGTIFSDQLHRTHI